MLLYLARISEEFISISSGSSGSSDWISLGSLTRRFAARAQPCACWSIATRSGRCSWHPPRRLCTLPSVLADIQILTVNLAHPRLLDLGHFRCVSTSDKAREDPFACLDPLRGRVILQLAPGRVLCAPWGFPAFDRNSPQSPLCLTMNDMYNGPSSRGVPHAEASADTLANTAASLATDSSRTGQVQVPRSPQPLSLQVNGLEAGVYSGRDSNVSYVESSDRGSETSDGQRPELHSASTFTDSAPSQPSSSLNDSNRSMELDKPYYINGDIAMANTNEEIATLEALHNLKKTNGNGLMNGTNGAVKLEKQTNGSLSPLRSSNLSNLRSSAGSRHTPGHKRTVTGDVKHIPTLAAPASSDVNGARRRSKSTGSPAHGSRIAQVRTLFEGSCLGVIDVNKLSVHIRTRLSYAAAKIEKSRQSPSNTELALRGLESLSTSNIPSSALGSTPTSNSQSSQRPSSTDATSNHHTHHRSHSAISSPGKLLQIPKLAPPVDIVASSGDTRRRRPNPNWAAQPFDRSPYVRHRRHHSYQDPSFARPFNGSPRVMGPGTPSIPPTSRTPTSSQNGYYGLRTQSENTAMEQDAIETLLFMSSPENSGYRSSPRPLQPPTTQHSLNASLYADNEKHGTEAGTQHSQSPQSGESIHSQDMKSRSLGLGLEAHAGDEIDRILDQMDSDSEEDARYASHRLGKNQHIRRHHGRRN